MTGEVSLFKELKDYDGGYVNFAGDKGGRITGNGTVSNDKITLEQVHYVEQSSIIS